MINYTRLEGLYSSSKIDDIFKFYEIVPDVRTLVDFSRKRKRAQVQTLTLPPPKIAVGHSDSSEFAFVIPTPNATSGRARALASFFRLGTIVFVQSSGQFFNYATSVNKGLDEAARLNPDWIILSNDDVYPVDPIEKLLRSLDSEKDADVVMACPGYINGVWFHTHEAFFYSGGTLSELLLDISRSRKEYLKIKSICKKFRAKLGLLADYPTTLTSKHFYANVAFYRYIKKRHSKASFTNFGDFCAFRKSVVSKYRFDETYINNGEDVDLSFRLHLDRVRIRVSNFRIGSGISTTLGTERARRIRGILNSIYLANKFGSLLL